jgi:hypothetical protein
MARVRVRVRTRVSTVIVRPTRNCTIRQAQPPRRSRVSR